MTGPYRKDIGRFVITELKARTFWRRSDLRERPFASMQEVARELERCGVRVFAVRDDCLECEPRPTAIWEILTGTPCRLPLHEVYGTQREEPGQALRHLKELGLPGRNGHPG